MINDKSFKLGENVKLKVYKVDEYNGDINFREVEGKVIQVTPYLVVIQRKHIRESFKYSELNPINDIQPVKDLYKDDENYREDIIEDCANAIKNNEEGYVFSVKQVEDTLNKLSEEITRKVQIKFDNGIFRIKKIKNY